MPKRSRFAVLSRLFTRTTNTVVGQLHAHALNRPLLVEPRIGEQLLGAYLQGDVDYPEFPLEQTAGAIRVINISGALVSRPMPGPSGGGPQCYEEITEAIDEAVDDSNVSAIVLRMDTPGGFVAGCFDLTDHIFESRGKKPIHAVVDDMAYSAGFAIAAACDEIWVTRTAGVGSVGVVGWHLDQSKFDEQIGVKLTPIYAGAHKIDGSSHFPLSDEAKQRHQVEIDRLYGIFTTSVAKYRDLKVEAVTATEALTYAGQEAIDIGFADRIGTLEDALQFLAKGEQQPSAPPAPTRSEEERDTAAAAAEALRVQQAEIQKGRWAVALSGSGLPAHIVAALLKVDVSPDAATARIAHAAEVISTCRIAKADARAEAFVTQHTAIDVVRKTLHDEQVARDEERKLSITLPPGSTGGGARVPGVWDKTIVKFGGTLQ